MRQIFHCEIIFVLTRLSYLRASNFSETMNTTDKSSLFTEFPSQSKAQWAAQVAKDLKGLVSADDLQWTSPDGVTIPAYLTSEDIENTVFLTKEQKGWAYRETLAVTDESAANRDAHTAFEKGAQEVAFTQLLPNTDFAKLLKGIALKNQPIYLQLTHNSTNFLHFLKLNNPSLAALKGGLNHDFLADYLTHGTAISTQYDLLQEAFEALKEAPYFSVLQVGSHHFHEAGASAAQEIAFLLVSLVEYWHELTERGITVADLQAKTELSTSVGTHYFVEIAKQRALRLLLANVLKAFGANEAKSLRIHAQTSAYAYAQADKDTNLLRHTTEAMSAALGGVDSMSIANHGAENQEFALRIARNISTLLREESYLDRVTDAASGSYYIEFLTNQLAQAAWQLFQEVEAKGGFTAAVRQNFIQQQIAATQANNEKLWHEKKWVMVGTNKYPNAKEKTEAVRPNSEAGYSPEGFQLLIPQPLANVVTA